MIINYIKYNQYLNFITLQKILHIRPYHILLFDTNISMARILGKDKPPFRYLKSILPDTSYI